MKILVVRLLGFARLLGLKSDSAVYNKGYAVEPRYNEDPVITNNIWKPGRITVKYVETNPAIMNPAITNPAITKSLL